MFQDLDQKFVAGALILAAWGGLVLAGYVPAAEYVSVLRDTLIGLGVFKIALTSPKQ